MNSAYNGGLILRRSREGTSNDRARESHFVIHNSRHIRHEPLEKVIAKREADAREVTKRLENFLFRRVHIHLITIRPIEVGKSGEGRSRCRQADLCNRVRSTAFENARIA